MDVLHVVKRFGLEDQVFGGLRNKMRMTESAVEDARHVLRTCAFTKHFTNTSFGFYYPMGSNRKLFVSHEISLHANFFTPEKKTEFVQVLLHEIAHAIAYKIFKKSGHCRVWKNISLAIGDDGKRCGSHEGVLPYNYTYTCLTCGTKHYTLRMLKGMDSRYHAPCKRKEHGGRFVMKCARTGKEISYARKTS